MKIIAPTFLLPFLLMLGSSSGRIKPTRDIDRLITKHCNIKHSFVVVVIGNSYMGNTYLFAIYACSGALVKPNFVLTTLSCYYRNGGTHDFEKPQDMTIIAGFEKKYVAEAQVIWVFNVYTEDYGKVDGFVLLMLDKSFKMSPGVSIIKRASKGQAVKCKHAKLVSAVVLHEMKVKMKRMPTTVDVHVLCSGVKVIEQSVCDRLWPWVMPLLSLCGETKPRYWLDGFHLETDSLVCEQALGSPLVCDGVLIGFQGKCERNDENYTSFMKIDYYLAIIDYVFLGYRSLKGKNKKTTGMRASNGADFFDGTSWKMAAGIGTVLFVYF